MSTSKNASSAHFEFAGQTLALAGTSGPSKLEHRTAEGRPVLHSVEFGGQILSLRGTSGLTHPHYTVSSRSALANVQGEMGIRPTQGMTQPIPGMGQPTAIGGLAGIYPKAT